MVEKAVKTFSEMTSEEAKTAVRLCIRRALNRPGHTVASVSEALNAELGIDNALIAFAPRPDENGHFPSVEGWRIIFEFTAYHRGNILNV